jgi:hypothetical protein
MVSQISQSAEALNFFIQRFEFKFKFVRAWYKLLDVGRKKERVSRD